MSWLTAPFAFEFMQQALAASVLIAAAAGALSCFLVLKGWSLMGDAISHAVLPGIVAAVTTELAALGANIAEIQMFDHDQQSPIFQMRPDHRAQLFNQTGKSDWSFKDFAMGVGIATRKFPPLDRRALHHSLIWRIATPKEELPERKAYKPESLKALWPAIEEMADRHASSDEALRARLEDQGDLRALRAPDSVRKYIVKPGDTLTEIAEREMGGKSHWELLALHNRNIGLLFDESNIYVGSELEIPQYKAQPETSSEASL